MHLRTNKGGIKTYTRKYLHKLACIHLEPVHRRLKKYTDVVSIYVRVNLYKEELVCAAIRSQRKFTLHS